MSLSDEESKRLDEQDAKAAQEEEARVVQCFEKAVDEDLQDIFSTAEETHALMMWNYRDSPGPFKWFNEGGDEEQVIFVPRTCRISVEFLIRYQLHPHETKYGMVYVTTH